MRPRRIKINSYFAPSKIPGKSQNPAISHSIQSTFQIIPKLWGQGLFRSLSPLDGERPQHKAQPLKVGIFFLSVWSTKSLYIFTQGIPKQTTDYIDTKPAQPF